MGWSGGGGNRNRYMLWANEGRMSGKLQNEQLAIASELRKYRTNYLHRELGASGSEPFVRFTRELSLLVTSHCKNILFVAPERVAGALDELGVVVEDLLGKYYQLCLKFNERVSDLLRPELRSPPSDLCLVCAQQIKKVEVDRMRKHILNEADLYQLAETEEQPRPEEEDLQFFAEVSELLTRRQGELLKNQLSMGLYQQEALAALASLIALKDSFTQTLTPPPNTSWQTSAKEEMQSQLKNCFLEKIPPWIAKMLGLFWRLQEREREGKGVQVGVQTGVSSQSQLLQMKRKMMLAKEKLDKSSQRMLTQEKEMLGLAGEKKELEIRVEYYRNQLNKLIEEIEHIKTENQVIRMKLAKGFPEEEKQSSIDLRLSRDNINGTARSKRPKALLASVEKGLPKIKRTSQENSREKRESQTSINLMSMTQSRSERPSMRRQEKISGLSLGSNHIEDILNKQKENSERNDRIAEREELKRQSNVIQEEEAETYLEEEKKKMEQVSTQLREIVRNMQVTPNPKHYYSSTLTSTQVKDGLRRVPRKTNHYSQLSGSPDILPNKMTTNCQIISSQISDALAKIYCYLKDEGFLIKMNEQQFKASILKIQDLNLNILASPDLSNFLQGGKGMDQSLMMRNQRLSVTRKEWNEQSYHIDNEEKPMSEEQMRQYFSLFRSQQNAYHYECSLTKNHLKGGYRMNAHQESACNDFYKLIEEIKRTSFDHYKFICSYMRYPFQLMQNDFGVVNLVNDMSAQNFQHYFQRILSIHIKCNRKPETSLCEHLEEVRSKLQQRVMQFNQ